MKINLINKFMKGKLKEKAGLSMREKLMKRKAELEKRSKGGAAGEWVFPKEGITRVRVLPITTDSEIGIELLTFYLGQELGGIISPATFGDPCPFLEAFKEAKGEGNKEKMKMLSPKRKYVIAGHIYKEGSSKEFDPDRMAKPIQIPLSLYQQLLDLYLDEDEWGDMLDYEDGYDIKIQRSGKSLDTVYTLAPCQKKSLNSKYHTTVDLEAKVHERIKSYEELEDLLKQYVNGDLDDGDEKARKAFSTKSKKSNVDGEEDDIPKKKKKDLPY
jgi:hypothetical protein